MGLIVVLSALIALRHPNILVSILFLSSMSLGASVLYLLLAAPDVAMTEAAIRGQGLTTLFFLFAFRHFEKGQKLLKALKTGCGPAFQLILLFSFSGKAQPGIPSTSAQYVEAAQTQFSTQNILTPILLTWRGFDTFGD
ncbi:MAG: DUF4040 domain-containing protein [Candidatus Cloacimonetes bacterium]|nr:DUF4040 domain-containing protein [Candidatus Cloacimonadota bacterium]